MTGRARVAVILRFRNEAPWLGAVLEAVRAQNCAADVEIVASDNVSTDGSRQIAEQHADRVLEIEDYRPGAALNRAIATTQCETVVVLSAHAVPADDRWLATLLGGLDDGPGVLAVYGAQVYPLTSRFLDKRDLDVFAHPDPRREYADSDFWNANSAFPREAWERVRFEESVFELEDHHWTKRQLPEPGRFVRFEPGAAVYHYGHDARNDRTFLPPGRPPPDLLIADSIRTLEAPGAPWPAVMAAGLALGSLSHEPAARRAVAAMGRHLVEHPDFDVRWRMAHALGRIGGPDAVPFLVHAMRDRSFYARDEAAWSLARLGADATGAVIAALPRLEPAHIPFAALALGLSGERAAEHRALMLLDPALEDPEPPIARDALYFLGELAAVPGAVARIPLVNRHLTSPDDDIARAAAWCWGRLAEREPAGAVDARACVAVAEDRDDGTVRAEAVIAVGRLARATGSTALIDFVAGRLATEPFGRGRYGAMQSLRLAAACGSERAASAARAHEGDPDFGVRFERDLALQPQPAGLACA